MLCTEHSGSTQRCSRFRRVHLNGQLRLMLRPEKTFLQQILHGRAHRLRLSTKLRPGRPLMRHHGHHTCPCRCRDLHSCYVLLLAWMRMPSRKKITKSRNSRGVNVRKGNPSTLRTLSRCAGVGLVQVWWGGRVEIVLGRQTALLRKPQQLTTTSTLAKTTRGERRNSRTAAVRAVAVALAHAPKIDAPLFYFRRSTRIFH